MDTRGKIHMNANDASRVPQNKKMNEAANMFVNQNHNIFEDYYGSPSSQTMDQPLGAYEMQD